MKLKRVLPFSKEIIIPPSLNEKLIVKTNCLVTEHEIDLFNRILVLINNHLALDNIDLSSRNRLNVFFINEDFSLSYDESMWIFGNHMSVVTYRIGKLRQSNSNILMELIFTEELVHHYWNIFDETIVKYKVVEILNDIYPMLTVDMLREVGANGLR